MCSHSSESRDTRGFLPKGFHFTLFSATFLGIYIVCLHVSLFSSLVHIWGLQGEPRTGGKREFISFLYIN